MQTAAVPVSRIARHLVESAIRRTLADRNAADEAGPAGAVFSL